MKNWLSIVIPSENPEGRDRLRYVEIGPRRWHLPRSAQINIKYSRDIVNWNLIKIIRHFYNFLTSRSESTFSIILLSCFSTSSTADLAQSLACASEDGRVTHHGTHTFDFSSHHLFPSLHYVYIMNGSHHGSPPSGSHPQNILSHQPGPWLGPHISQPISRSYKPELAHIFTVLDAMYVPWSY